MSINYLALPKGVKKDCEICGIPALIECPHCLVTYYCSQDHQRDDFDGIHEKICQFLAVLRRPLTTLGSEGDREQHKVQMIERKRHLMSLSLMEANKFVNQERYSNVIPAASQALRFARDLHGNDSNLLIPIFILLGSACIGTGNLKQAEAYLTQANWILIKAPCGDDIKSQLFRALGRLYDARGNYAQALRQFAEDVYHASLIFGDDNVRTAGGYFLLAGVFAHIGQPEQSSSFYKKVVACWLAYFQTSTKKMELDIAQKAEAVTHLRAIAMRTDQTVSADHTPLPKKQRLAILDSYAALAYAYSQVDAIAETQDWFARAITESEQLHGESHATTCLYRDALEKFLAAQ